MITGLVCPVCEKRISGSLSLGAKVTCPSCASVHRVRGDEDSAHLHILIENLEFVQEEAAEASAAADSNEKPVIPVGPKLTTWKDRARAETTSRSKTGGRSKTLSRRRR